jgi:hypothetical protein
LYYLIKFAEKFDPEYDRENYLGCTGGIGTPNPGPVVDPFFLFENVIIPNDRSIL